MVDWTQAYGVPSWGIPDPFAAQAARAQAQQQALQQALDAMRMEQALQSPFVQGLIRDLNAPVRRPEAFMPGPSLSPLLATAHGIAGEFPAAMGVPLLSGGASLPSGGARSGTPEPVKPEPVVNIKIGELVRVSKPKPGSKPNEVSANKPDLEPKLMGGSIGRTSLPVRPPASVLARAASPAASGPRTAEELAIMQQLLPQLTQRRIAQEQAGSAEDRKYADLRMQQEKLGIQTGYNVWAKSLQALVDLRNAETAARARLGAAAMQDRRLQDLASASRLVTSQLTKAREDLNTLLMAGIHPGSLNPADRQRFAEQQALVQQLEAQANSLGQNWMYLFNRKYNDNVPTPQPNQPIPRGPGAAQKTAPVPAPAKPTLSPKAQALLDELR